MGWQDAPVVDTPPGFIPDTAPPADRPTGFVPASPPDSDRPPGFVPDPGSQEAAPEPTADSLRASFRAVQDVSPDEQGKVLRIARDTGVPAGVVEGDPEGVARAAVPRQLELLPSHAPALAAHVQEPANMATAKDDLDNLRDLEWALSGRFLYGLPPPSSADQPALWWDALRKGVAGLRLGFEKTREALGLGPNVSAYADLADPFMPAFDVLGPFAGVARTIRQATREEAPADLVQRMKAADQAQAARELHAKSLAARAWVGAFQTAPFLAANAAAAATGGPFAALALNAGSVYGENVEQLGQVQGPRGEKLTPGATAALAGATSLAEGLVYTYGLRGLGRTLSGPVAKQIPGQILDRVLASTTIPKILAQSSVRWAEARTP